MSDTNPTGILPLIQFAETHKETWKSNSQQIGLTNAQATEYEALTNAARATYAAVEAGRLAQRASTLAQTQAIRELRTANSALLRIIRGFAQNAPDSNAVYQAAQIKPPAPPVPLGPPTTPFDITARLALTEGGIDIRWKATQVGSGVVYRVERSIITVTGAGPWTLVGLTGAKNSTDTTIPQGVSHVQYRVIAQRGSRTSNPSSVLDIRFGTGDGAGFVARELKFAA
jgi:hypothetical protein